ncbi:DUF3347 domain-containing protein [Lewinella sp. IMCC34183]|uniref:DUF3347 domain-containing protein n=1 Tax=Lewinella sp. IMCC34183 TaxID=2248762 RepID=UPI0013003DF8|nr:DUF3347 domain-containing protein [Lewinella sp. IMCC34183]
MTTTFLRSLILLSLFALTTCQEASPTAPGQETPVQFGDAQVDSIYHNYLDLQQALANSDPEQAAAAAAQLNAGFSASQAELRYLARHIAASNDLEVQRRYFFPMTDQLEPVFSSRMTQGTIYRMHCPAANNGVGADWYSAVTQVQNPYLGTAAPACGKVVSHLRGRG